MRVVFIGCVNFSYIILEHLFRIKRMQIVGIISQQNSSFNADFRSLRPIAEKKKIPYYCCTHNNQTDMGLWINDRTPDVIYCFGWPFLLKRVVLEIPRLGVIGYHPTALPLNRGRHPIIWTLALGLKKTASTFFFMDEGADSGDILNQEFVIIENGDDAGTLYEKLLNKAKKQVTIFSNQLIDGHYARIQQDSSKANYWRKRSKEDGRIDWRMSSRTIHNLVRALTKPYIGAHCIYNNSEVKIWRTEEILYFLDENIEPGKVLESKNNNIIVKCGESAIRITQHEFPKLPHAGEYL